MHVDILIETDTDLLDGLPLEELLAFAADQLELPDHAEVSLSFVSNDDIHALNRDYRGMDKPTDVLSFECDNQPFEGENLQSAPEFVLGDIIIAPFVALDQARELNTPFEDEISLLVIHGLLHLLGYDHIKDEEAEEMEALEHHILHAWNEQRHEA